MNPLSRYLRKNDYLLLAVLSFTAVISFAVQLAASMNHGSTVVVTVDGKEYGVYELSEDRIIPVIVDGKTVNTVIIRDNEAFMSEASCPDGLCMKQGHIKSDRQSIVCLPNRVVVTVSGGDDPEIDTMTD